VTVIGFGSIAIQDDGKIVTGGSTEYTYPFIARFDAMS